MVLVSLSDSRAMVQTLMSTTGIEDPKFARQLLEDNGWQLQAAGSGDDGGRRRRARRCAAVLVATGGACPAGAGAGAGDSNQAKCRNHGVDVLKQGHARKCPYETCACAACSPTKSLDAGEGGRI